jgi:hypothetical protein
MFYGAPARSLDDIAKLRRNGFDFGEIAIANAGARRMWWESGVINGGMGKFFLMAHGPLEGDPNDAGAILLVSGPLAITFLGVILFIGSLHIFSL